MSIDFIEGDVEQVAVSILSSSVASEHYDDGLLNELGDVRHATFRERHELKELSERIDACRFQLTTQ